MNSIDKEKLILSLIKDDLINTNLIYNLRKIGLHSECYYLHLSSTIFELMGFENSKEMDEVFNEYIEMADEAALMDITESNKEMEIYAKKIYEKLKRNRFNFSKNLT